MCVKVLRLYFFQHIFKNTLTETMKTMWQPNYETAACYITNKKKRTSFGQDHTFVMNHRTVTYTIA